MLPLGGVWYNLQQSEVKTRPAIKEALAKMSTAEKLQVMEFLWSALSSHFQVESPAWHDAILDERAHATEDEFEDWEDVKRELRVSAYAH